MGRMEGESEGREYVREEGKREEEGRSDTEWQHPLHLYTVHVHTWSIVLRPVFCLLRGTHLFLRNSNTSCSMNRMRADILPFEMMLWILLK